MRVSECLEHWEGHIEDAIEGIKMEQSRDFRWQSAKCAVRAMQFDAMLSS